MKKMKILFVMALFASQVCAADYTYKYLVFTGSDGTETRVSTDGLTLNVEEDGTLVAKNTAGTTTLTLASLMKMKFSSDDTTTPVEQAVNSVTKDGIVEVYDLSGIYKGTFSSMSAMKNSLGRGIYVIKQNGKNTKMIVK